MTCKVTKELIIAAVRENPAGLALKLGLIMPRDEPSIAEQLVEAARENYRKIEETFTCPDGSSQRR